MLGEVNGARITENRSGAIRNSLRQRNKASQKTYVTLLDELLDEDLVQALFSEDQRNFVAGLLALAIDPDTSLREIQQYKNLARPDTVYIPLTQLYELLGTYAEMNKGLLAYEPYPARDNVLRGLATVCPGRRNRDFDSIIQEKARELRNLSELKS